jgi:hypothetical protein
VVGAQAADAALDGQALAGPEDAIRGEVGEGGEGPAGTASVGAARAPAGVFAGEIAGDALRRVGSGPERVPAEDRQRHGGEQVQQRAGGRVSWRLGGRSGERVGVALLQIGLGRATTAWGFLGGGQERPHRLADRVEGGRRQGEVAGAPPFEGGQVAFRVGPGRRARAVLPRGLPVPRGSARGRLRSGRQGRGGVRWRRGSLRGGVEVPGCGGGNGLEFAAEASFLGSQGREVGDRPG